MTLKSVNTRKSLVLATFTAVVLSAAGAFASLTQAPVNGQDCTYTYGDFGYGYGYGYGYSCTPKKTPSRGGGGGSSYVAQSTTGEVTTGTVTTGIDLKPLINSGIQAFLTTDAGKTALNSVAESNLPDEWKQAYLFARAFDITTMPTIAEARMEDKITRIEFAKMISNYAVNILGKKADTAKKCEFTDTNTVNDELKAAAITACQLDIMGINPDKTPLKEFMPYQLLKRADFATVISRLYFGSTYEGGANYYSNHIKALFDKEVIKVTDPTLDEVRGYIMIALMRISNILK